jgi:hypothetical protein
MTGEEVASMLRCAATPARSVAAARRPPAYLRGVRFAAVTCALAVVAMTGATRATAQVFPGDQVPVRPIRIEGYWDRTKADPAVIGEVTISADGRDRRTFGATAVQAYKPEEEGMAALRHTALQPALLLRGKDDLIRKLYAAGPGDKVTILGVYGAGAATLTLNSVDVAS